MCLVIGPSVGPPNQRVSQPFPPGSKQWKQSLSATAAVSNIFSDDVKYNNPTQASLLMLYSIESTSHCIFVFSWFASTMKTSLPITFVLVAVVFVGHQLHSVGSTRNKHGPSRISPASVSQHHDSVNEGTNYRRLVPDVTKETVDHGAANSKKSSDGSYCDM